MHWRFWIDVGGTFTDCVALSPLGQRQLVKVLSSAITKGVGARSLEARSVRDAARIGDPPRLWVGCRLRWIDTAGQVVRTGRVIDFASQTGALTVDQWQPCDPAALAPAPLPRGATAAISEHTRGDHATATPPIDIGPYELTSGEEAPLLAMRRLLGLALSDSFPPCEVRLGTTRGTNALLERKGARTAFVTTRGFGDVLRIANQDRPRLFDLDIRKPEPLNERVIEADERIAVDGQVLAELNQQRLRDALTAARDAGIGSLAVCLLHAWVNPQHELEVAEIARNFGFNEISLSHEVAPRIKIVPRGDTTVLDAYLTPVLREYVASIERTLQPHGRLRLMTSAGGLVSPEHFSGCHSLLSGPAGGVIGFARVADQAGFPRAIGFDMGGTSTDVARYDGRYEYEYETQKAGIRVATPQLAIETVAAGGGSLCGFDGVQLFVGPESAGADPGPACYGRGGPLTITDANLALGKLVEDEFPFPLDRAAVDRRLADLCDAIAASPLGKSYTPLELAEGFVALANVAMTRAIRNISVARGYDPADYALTTFGGAGGQHACALADALRMRTILVHPLAGVLSAYGMGLADIRRQGERPVLRAYSLAVLAELETEFRALEQALRGEVELEGIRSVDVDPPQRSLDLRYRGVDAALNIPCPPDGDYAAAYAERHEQVYGYRHHGRPIEIAVLRVEVVGRTPNPEPQHAERNQCSRPSPAAIQFRDVWFNGCIHQARLYRRAALQPGDELFGPAILCEPTSTLIIDPGWRAVVTDTGNVVLARDPAPEHLGEAEMRSTRAGWPSRTTSRGIGDTADPVALEIFHNHFASIAEQMGVTLQRTAISTNVKERLDFSCALFDREGRLVVNAPHIPVHLGAMGETVRAVMADNPDWQPGDVIVTNDPYRGGSHLPDVTVVTPVHDPASRELLFITASRAHHAEIGGIVPGSVPPFSKNLAEEGVLLRNVRLVDRGVSREAELRALLLSGPYPSRRVEDNLADVAAQVAANRLGAKLLLELVGQHGFPRVDACMTQIREAAALKMRRALARHGAGVYTRVDHLDDGTPIAVTVTIADERATIDFTGSGPVHPGNLNANRAIVTAAVMYVFRCLIRADLPLNAGVLEPLTIVIPEGLLNPPAAADPRNCPAIVGGNVETSQRIVDVLLGALGLAAASQGTMNNLTFGDDRFGYYETICGGSGATPQANGADAVHTHMTNTRLTDVEVLELRYPVRVQEFSIRRGSGGAGRNRGGDGIVRRLEFLRPLKVSILSQRRGEQRPFGLNDGAAGAAGRNQIRRAGSSEWQDVGGAFQTQVQPGDVLQIETPGGGGYGAESPRIASDAPAKSRANR